ncbi:MAG TPA: hypothetical protein VK864_01035 [Longimicrobiales bacterium]|nr:hypothetical protein [Longimicrobiales bacterium]
MRLFLRDFRTVEASINLAENQTLASWLLNSRSYVNLRGAEWGTNGRVKHAALKISQVLWALPMDHDIPLVATAPQPHPRPVEIQLEGSLVLRAGLNIGARQRLSDYLESQGQFIAVRSASLLRSGRPPKQVNVTLGDIVLNQEAVQAIWEIAGDTVLDETEPAESAARR